MKPLFTAFLYLVLNSFYYQHENPIDLHCESVVFLDGSVKMMQVKEFKKTKFQHECFSILKKQVFWSAY